MQRLAPFAVLLGAGAAWGLTIPLMRVAVSTGYRPLGLIVWQNVILAGVLILLLRLMRRPWPAARRNAGLFAMVAVFGSVLPAYFSFLTAGVLPAGVRAIIIAVVPMFVLPMALLLGFERPRAVRAVGVALGALAIVLIVGPQGGGAPAALVPVLLALIAPLSYAVEANYLAWRGSHGLHPFELLLGAALVALALAWPLAQASGQMVYPVRWGAAEWATLAIGLLNALAYSGYVWLVGRAGSVFASQVAYLVTGFGVVWSKLLLDESYALAVWGAFALMLGGIALIQPLQAKPKGT